MQKNHAYSQVSNRQGCGIGVMFGKTSMTNSQGDWNSTGEGGGEGLKVIVLRPSVYTVNKNNN